MTAHHLIPKTEHRRRWVIETYGRERCRTDIAWLCAPCHRHLHRCISERDLAKHYPSIALLSEHPEIQAFVQWIQTKPDEFVPKPAKRKIT
ncbi:MAG: hypothetical protein EBS77_00615 [Gammaproteobacteria bacterium]|nr:hypothetical protein [Gammaproteobacteria bacterium]